MNNNKPGKKMRVSLTMKLQPKREGGKRKEILKERLGSAKDDVEEQG